MRRWEKSTLHAVGTSHLVYLILCQMECCKALDYISFVYEKMLSYQLHCLPINIIIKALSQLFYVNCMNSVFQSNYLGPNPWIYITPLYLSDQYFYLFPTQLILFTWGVNLHRETCPHNRCCWCALDMSKSS